MTLSCLLLLVRDSPCRPAEVDNLKRWSHFEARRRHNIHVTKIGGLMRPTLVAVLALVGVVLVGCADDVKSAQPASDENTTTTTVIAAPSVSKSAFTEVIAELAPLLTQFANDAEADCHAAESAPCQRAYGMIELLAQRLHDDLVDRHDPSSNAYVGVPPDEISSLLLDTETLADKTVRMAGAYKTAQCPDVLSSCIQERLFAQMATDELTQKLAAWGAHI